MTKITTTQSIANIFNAYDAGTRTSSMRRLMSEKTISHVVENGYFTDQNMGALIKHVALTKGAGKVAMLQIAKCFDLIATGDIESVEKATAGMISVAMLCPDGTAPQLFENARFAFSAKGNENSKHLINVSGSRLRKVIGSITNSATVSAQMSRSVGQNGSLTIMCATRKVSAHEFIVIPGSNNNPFLLAYSKALAKLPEGDLVAKLEKVRTEA